MKTVLTTRPLHPSVSEKFAENYELRIASTLSSETMAREARQCDALIVRDPIDPEVLADPGQLRMAVRHGAGLDMIPVDVATAAGVLVSSAPGANAPAVGEHVAMVTLSLLRRLDLVRETLTTAGWDEARKAASSAKEVGASTVGVVGLGNVGSRVAHIFHQGFGARVLGFDVRVGHSLDGVELGSLDRLMAESDVIVLCCPLTEETYHLVSADRISQLRPSTILVNASRGPVVDQAALASALASGAIAGAALDVFEVEPLGPEDVLHKTPRTLITPHVAAVTEPSDIRVGMTVLSELDRLFAGSLPRYLADPAAVPRFNERFSLQLPTPSPSSR